MISDNAIRAARVPGAALMFRRMAPGRRIFIMHGERGLTPAFIARSFHRAQPSLLSVQRALKFDHG